MNKASNTFNIKLIFKTDRKEMFHTLAKKKAKVKTVGMFVLRHNDK